MKEQPNKELGPDGVLRPAEVEQRLNRTLATVFAGAAGQSALEYLRSITVNWVSGPNESDASLRHREGMRFLYAVIEQRVERGKAQ